MIKFIILDNYFKITNLNDLIIDINDLKKIY